MSGIAVEVCDLVKRYPGRMALDHVSFKISQGAIHGFLGPNGAGKTTTIKILTGMLKPLAGTAYILGFNLSQDLAKIKKQLGYLPEVPPLYLELNVKDFLKFVAKIHDIPNDHLESNIQYALEKTGLTSVKDRLIGNLSKGFRQRVGIAQAIVHRPSLIILDEPTAGLDPASIKEIRQLILSLKGEHTVFLSTHLLHEATLCCDEITIINEGKIIASDSLAAVQKMVQNEEVFVVEAANWNDHIEQYVRSHMKVSRLVIHKNSHAYSIRVYGVGITQDRQKIIQDFIDSGCDVLGLHQEKPQLEDVFLKLTQNHGESHEENDRSLL